MKLTELKLLGKKHGIKGCTGMNKPELVQILTEIGVIHDGDDSVDFLRLATIRKNPRSVYVTDIKLDEQHFFKSIYMAAKFLGISPPTVARHNNNMLGDFHIYIKEDGNQFVPVPIQKENKFIFEEKAVTKKKEVIKKKERPSQELIDELLEKQFPGHAKLAKLRKESLILRRSETA